MELENIKLLIDEYLDGELDIEKENYLFSVLSSNIEAREYFKNMQRFKNLIKKSEEAFPTELDNKILTASRNKVKPFYNKNKRKTVFEYITYAMAVILIALGFYFAGQVKDQNKKIELASQKIEQQQKLINLIMSNQLSPITVESNYDNEIVIKANM